MPNPQPRHRRWCFTINNPTSSDEFGARLLFRGATYGIYGHEICPKTKTPHLQGYVHLKSAVTFTKLKTFVSRAHLEPAIADDFTNQTYCTKGENIFTVGEPSLQGERTDVQEAN